MTDQSEDAQTAFNLDSDLIDRGEAVIALLKSGVTPVVLTGPAGTGKTQLIKYIVNRIEGQARIVAYTGQAARMLRQRGLPASTIHSLIYLPAEKAHDKIKQLKADIAAAKSKGLPTNSLEGQLLKLTTPGWILNDESELVGARVCIIDEVSMVGSRLGQDIEDFGVPVLAVGDPYQLGPVDDTEAHFDLQSPNVQLTKIFRQGEGSLIVGLSKHIRDGKPLPVAHEGQGKHMAEVTIRAHKAMNNQDQQRWCTRADQILCATNKVRTDINRRMLGYLGMANKRYPSGSVGEKLICLRNDAELGIFNGQPIRLSEVDFSDNNALWFRADIFADMGGDDGWERVGRAKIYKGWFDATADRIKHDDARRRAQVDLSGMGNVVQLDWGFCLTVHKAQGSEWEKVLFIAESWPDEPVFRRRLQYTAITRASRLLRIITNWGHR